MLNQVHLKHIQTNPVTFEESSSYFTKVLGLNWDPKVDLLSFKYHLNQVKFSKRAALSEKARIYDPFGLFSPVTTDLKRLMKYLWIAEMRWNEPLPEDAATASLTYHQKLPELVNSQINRLVTCPQTTYELHGFCGSSEAAYAAAVYLRVTSEN